MTVRLEDRRRRSKPRRRLWRYLRAATHLLLRRPTVSVAVIALTPDGRIVLARRVDSDLWGLPGGMLDWGEEVAAAAQRELREEIGMEIRLPVRLQGVYSAAHRDPRTHAVCITVVAEVAGAPDIRDPMEVSEVHAFAPEELPFGYLAHDHERQLRDYLRGATVVA